MINFDPTPAVISFNILLLFGLLEASVIMNKTKALEEDT